MGFIISILILGIAIFLCCEYYSIKTAEKDYQQLTKSCSRSAAYALYNMTLQEYLSKGKNQKYSDIDIAIDCQGFTPKQKLKLPGQLF